MNFNKLGRSDPETQKHSRPRNTETNRNEQKQYETKQKQRNKRNNFSGPPPVPFSVMFNRSLADLLKGKEFRFPPL
jgi:hypothetical protein